MLEHKDFIYYIKKNNSKRTDTCSQYDPFIPFTAILNIRN